MASSAEPAAAPVGRRRVALFSVVAFLVVAVDQLTKWWAVERLDGHDPIPVVGDLLSLRFVLNPGAALGTGAGYTIVLSAIAIAVTITLIVIAPRLRDTWWAVGLGLFLGGAVGNLMDRLFREPAFLRGHVVDFIDYAGFFVGNVADIALTVAAIVIIWRSWRGHRFDGTREPT
ncbi:signal peptidase II [Aeromicrobium duanguangcaii]|uniref:signal peptidase II n=1 Tax=Aeromicrobium duanguangcaii TaxID=2968086 RepID=UPI0020172D1D|nr:signal peptidase II [Aeromicrobium duanguangcaii]